MKSEWIRSVNENIQRAVASNAKRREEISRLENLQELVKKDLADLMEWKHRFDEVASVTQVKEHFAKIGQFDADHHKMQIIHLTEWQTQFTQAMTLTQLQELIKKVNQLELDNARSKMIFWVVQAGIGLLVGLVSLFGAFKTVTKAGKAPSAQTQKKPLSR